MREVKTMKRIMLLTLLFAMLASVGVTATAAEKETAVVDFGNTFCPVMGAPVADGQFVVYEGVRYGICCPGCKEAFLKDPAKYIAQLKDNM